MKHDNARSVQILKTLKDELLKGRYSKAGVFPSEIALARRFGVSRSMMTSVVNELEKQRFVSRSQGRRTVVTRQGRSRLIGLVIPGVSYSSSYFQKIIAALIKEAQKSDYSIIVDGVWTDDADGNGREAVEVAARLIRRKAAGVVYQPVEYSKISGEVNRRVLSAFSRAHIPVVLLDSDVVPWPRRSPYDLVSIDDVAAGMVLADLMMGGGARNVHFITRLLVDNVNNRIRGVRDAVLERGLKWSDSHVSVVDPGKPAVIRALMRRRPRPDALICESGTLAAELMVILNKLGYTVPKDVQIAGFGDRDCSRQFMPALTMIAQPGAELATAAFGLLMERMRNPLAVPTHKVLPFVLDEKGSTRKEPRR